MKRYVVLTGFCLLMMGSLAVANSFYTIFGINYTLPNKVNFNQKQSDVMQIPDTGGWGVTGFNERYSIDSASNVGFNLGAGYRLAPLFAAKLFVSNDIEITAVKQSFQYNGERQEWLSSDYPGTPLAYGRGVTFNLHDDRYSLLANYVLNTHSFGHNKFAKKFTAFAQVGAGLTYYDYSTTGDTNPLAAIGTESFNKNGINVPIDLGLGLRFQVASHTAIKFGYEYIHNLMKEEITPKWDAGANQASVTPSVINPGQSSIKLEGPQSYNQFYLNLLVQI